METEFLSQNLIIFSVFVFLVAGFVKGCIGMGLPLISLSLLTLYTTPRTAMTLIIIPTLLTNFLQFANSKNKTDSLKSYAPLLLFLFVCVYVASLLSFSLLDNTLSLILGLIILAFVSLQYFGNLPMVPPRYRVLTQCIFGCLIGISGGITNVWAPTIGAILLLNRVKKEEFIGLTGLFIFVGSIALAFSYGLNKKVDGELFLLSLGFLIPAIIGFFLGEKARNHISEEKFFQILIIFLSITSINLIWKSSILF